MEDVFYTNDIVELSYVRHLLSEAGIPAFVLDEHSATIDGRGPILTARVSVRKEDAARARLVLKELD